MYLLSLLKSQTDQMIMIWKPRAIFVPISHRNHSDDDLFIAQLDFWIQSSTLIDRIENHKPIFTKLRQKHGGSQIRRHADQELITTVADQVLNRRFSFGKTYVKMSRV